MKNSKFTQQYSIPFSGLKAGLHNFTFLIDNQLKDFFSIEEFLSIQATANVAMEKKETMLMFDFSIKGILEMNCDRCNAPINHDFFAEQDLIVKFSDRIGSEENDILFLSSQDHEIDLSHYIYELILLHVPLKKAHESEDLCDTDVIKALKKLEIKTSTVDPRWEKLKNLRINN